MTDLPSDILQLARQPGLLTACQLEAIEHVALGYGVGRSARILRISRSAVYSRRENAARKLQAELERLAAKHNGGPR